jgi:hypothetical protein
MVDLGPSQAEKLATWRGRRSAKSRTGTWSDLKPRDASLVTLSVFSSWRDAVTSVGSDPLLPEFNDDVLESS